MSPSGRDLSLAPKIQTPMALLALMVVIIGGVFTALAARLDDNASGMQAPQWGFGIFILISVGAILLAARGGGQGRLVADTVPRRAFGQQKTFMLSMRLSGRLSAFGNAIMSCSSCRNMPASEHRAGSAHAVLFEGSECPSGKSAQRVRGPTWGRPAVIFEHRSGAACWGPPLKNWEHRSAENRRRMTAAATFRTDTEGHDAASVVPPARLWGFDSVDDILTCIREYGGGIFAS
jgi:hypothetical protein